MYTTQIDVSCDFWGEAIDIEVYEPEFRSQVIDRVCLFLELPFNDYSVSTNQPTELLTE